jgi:hypothetical protein
MGHPPKVPAQVRKRMSTCALKKYAHMATTRSGGCEQRPELYATFLRAGALATRHTHIKHTNLPVLVTHLQSQPSSIRAGRCTETATIISYV